MDFILWLLSRMPLASCRGEIRYKHQLFMYMSKCLPVIGWPFPGPFPGPSGCSLRDHFSMLIYVFCLCHNLSISSFHSMALSLIVFVTWLFSFSVGQNVFYTVTVTYSRYVYTSSLCSSPYNASVMQKSYIYSSLFFLYHLILSVILCLLLLSPVSKAIRSKVIFYRCVQVSFLFLCPENEVMRVCLHLWRPAAKCLACLLCQISFLFSG